MDKKGYIIDISKQKNFDKQLGGKVIRNILYSFVTRVKPTAYDCHKDLTRTYEKYNRTIDYKNVHRRIQILYSHKLIRIVKPKENEKPIHNRVPYRLTSLGLFYMYLYNITSTNELIINYSQNEFFKFFLYPYIELKTVKSLTDKSILQEINKFLSKCCQSIDERYLSSLKEIIETGGLVTQFGFVPTLSDPLYTDEVFLGSKHFIQQLKDNFKINWLNTNTTTIQEVKKYRIIKIIEGKRELLLKVDPRNLEAILYEGDKVLYTFVLEKSGKKGYILNASKVPIDLENYVTLNEYGLELDIKQNVNELCLRILEKNAEFPYDTKVKNEREYNNKVLRKDEVFNRTINTFKAEIDRYYEEFMNKK